MTALTEKQFEILPSEDAANGFVFGIGADISVEMFDPGEVAWLTQDSQNSRRGVTGFGRDVPSGKTWLWTSHTDQQTEEEAVELLDRFSDAWMPDTLVRIPGAITALRYRLAGRNRRVYGRPRRYSAPPTNLIMSGYVPVTHDFSCVDSFTYSDLESSAQIPYVSTVEGGGFVLPAPMPLDTQASEGVGGDQLSVGGTARTYPRIRFNGPWTNPVFITDDWTLQWTGQIPAGGWVEIDARPWKLTVLDQAGASAVEGLDRKTWLEDLWFAPGSRPQVALGGSAASGSASALVRWRDAWKSI